MNEKKPSNLPVIIGTVLAGLIVLAAAGLVIFGNSKMGADSTPEATDTTSFPDNGPAGLESGGIVFGSDLHPIINPAPVNRAAGEVDVIVYVDYRCPHCMAFEETNGQALESALRGGNTTVEVRPLTFMDRFSADSAYSSRTAAAMACAVENQPEIAWTLHNLLLSSTVQPTSEGPGYTNPEIIDLINIVAPETNSAFEDCVLTQRYVPFASAVNDWTFQNPAPGALDTEMRIEGTPLVMVGGEVYDGPINNSAEFIAYLVSHGVKFD